jgi:hypothetical protein
MRNAQLREVTARLSADVRSGRYEPDWDLGKSEYLGESQEMEAAYRERARPVLDVYRSRGLVTEEELADLIRLAPDHNTLADRLQALAETLPPD